MGRAARINDAAASGLGSATAGQLVAKRARIKTFTRGTHSSAVTDAKRSMKFEGRENSSLRRALPKRKRQASAASLSLSHRKFTSRSPLDHAENTDFFDTDSNFGLKEPFLGPVPKAMSSALSTAHLYSACRAPNCESESLAFASAKKLCSSHARRGLGLGAACFFASEPCNVGIRMSKIFSGGKKLVRCQVYQMSYWH